MKATELLKGKRIKVMTDAKVEVILEIKSVEEQRHSRDVGPSNAANDWWPIQETWSTIEIKFTNGFTKSYSSLSSINIVE